MTLSLYTIRIDLLAPNQRGPRARLGALPSVSRRSRHRPHETRSFSLRPSRRRPCLPLGLANVASSYLAPCRPTGRSLTGPAYLSPLTLTLPPSRGPHTQLLRHPLTARPHSTALARCSSSAATLASRSRSMHLTARGRPRRSARWQPISQPLQPAAIAPAANSRLARQTSATRRTSGRSFRPRWAPTTVCWSIARGSPSKFGGGQSGRHSGRERMR